MVQVIVKPSEKRSEWTILELQGELISRTNEGFGGATVGDLYFNRNAEPIMIIGHHILYGKVKQLDKPFAVLCKNTQTLDGGYQIKAIVKTKLVFSLRPKPIIIHVPKKV